MEFARRPARKNSSRNNSSETWQRKSHSSRTRTEEWSRYVLPHPADSSATEQYENTARQLVPEISEHSPTESREQKSSTQQLSEAQSKQSVVFPSGYDPAEYDETQVPAFSPVAVFSPSQQAGFLDFRTSGGVIERVASVGGYVTIPNSFGVPVVIRGGEGAGAVTGYINEDGTQRFFLPGEFIIFQPEVGDEIVTLTNQLSDVGQTVLPETAPVENQIEQSQLATEEVQTDTQGSVQASVQTPLVEESASQAPSENVEVYREAELSQFIINRENTQVTGYAYADGSTASILDRVEYDSDTDTVQFVPVVENSDGRLPTITLEPGVPIEYPNDYDVDLYLRSGGVLTRIPPGTQLSFLPTVEDEIIYFQPLPEVETAQQQALPDEGSVSGEDLLPPESEPLNSVQQPDSQGEQLPQTQAVSDPFQTLNEADSNVYADAADTFGWTNEQSAQAVAVYGASRQALTDYGSSEGDYADLTTATLISNRLVENQVESAEERERSGPIQMAKDLVAAVLGTVEYGPEVLGEEWEQLKANWPRFVGTLVTLLLAEKAVLLLAASPDPTFVTKALAVALQGLLVATYGYGFVTEGRESLLNIDEFLTTVVHANGEAAEIEKASKALVRAVGHGILAVLSASGLGRQMSPARTQALSSMINRPRLARLPRTQRPLRYNRRTGVYEPTPPGSGPGYRYDRATRSYIQVLPQASPQVSPRSSGSVTTAAGGVGAQSAPVTAPESSAVDSAAASVPETADLQFLKASLSGLLDRDFTATELEAASQGRLLDYRQIDQMLREVGHWERVKDLFVAYPGLMRQFLAFRQQEVLSWGNEVFGGRGDLNLFLTDGNGVILGLLMDLLAAGSVSLSSDIDATVFSEEGNESLESAGVDQLNEVARRRWNNLEPGVLFDVNFYTRGHMRSPAFGNNAKTFGLINQLLRRLDAIEESLQPLTRVEKGEIARTVAEINAMHGNIISTSSLRALDSGDINALQDRILFLQDQFSGDLVAEYSAKRAEHGTGPEFDELSQVMSLVQQREYWENETLSTGQSGWEYTKRRLSRSPDTTERFQRADEIHTELVAERQQRIDTIGQQTSANGSSENIEIRASNELYVEYLKRADATLAEIRAAKDSSAAAEIIQPLQLQLQDLISRALFFANEAYMTPAAVEHIVLNMQLEYGLDLSVQSYATSINSQIAFIGEKIERSSDSFGLALWSSAKYIRRIADAAKRMQTKNEVLSDSLYSRTQTMDSYAQKLDAIKKSEQIPNAEKTQQAEELAATHPEYLGTNLTEFKQIVLDLQIDLQVEIQRYLDLQ